MRYEPGMLALCIDPLVPKQMVTLLERYQDEVFGTAWMVRFPSEVCWPCLDADGVPTGDGPIYGTDGIIEQRYLILLPDADPVETETEREVTA